MLITLRRCLLVISLLAATLISAQNDQVTGQKVEITTTFGSMTVLLYDQTPQHRDNFIKLVQEGFYNDLLFHRVIDGFMLQGGDPDSKGAAPGAALGQGGPGYTIQAEIVDGYYHKKGALAAARQGDQINPEKRSSGSQFYIVDGRTYVEADLQRLNTRKQKQYYMAKMKLFLADTTNREYLTRLNELRAKQDNEGLNTLNKEIEGAIDSSYGPPPAIAYTQNQLATYAADGGAPHLDGDYTVFGEVVQGMEVIDAIAGVATDGRARPLDDILMTITLVE